MSLVSLNFKTEVATMKMFVGERVGGGIVPVLTVKPQIGVDS